MRRIGVDLGAIDAPPIGPSVSECPGALLRLSRDEYREYERGGERFLTPCRDVPFDARGDVRLMCSNQVMSQRGCSGHIIEYGLCASCSGLEARHREALRTLKKMDGGR